MQRFGSIVLKLAKEACIVAAAAAVILVGRDQIDRLLAVLARSEAISRSDSREPLVAVGASLLSVSTGRGGALVVVTTRNCPHCVRSQEFHRRLISNARKNKLTVVVAVPSIQEQSDLLTALGSTSGEGREWKDLGFRVSGTPTVVLVGAGGAVTLVRVGRQDDRGERSLLNAVQEAALAGSNSNKCLQCLDGMPSVGPGHDIRAKELGGVRQRQPMKIVDVRERDEFRSAHKPGAVNLPMQELEARAIFELDRSELAVVDCANLREYQCRRATELLIGEGYRALSVDSGSYGQSCEAGKVEIY